MMLDTLLVDNAGTAVIAAGRPRSQRTGTEFWLETVCVDEAGQEDVCQQFMGMSELFLQTQSWESSWLYQIIPDHAQAQAQHK